MDRARSVENLETDLDLEEERARDWMRKMRSSDELRVLRWRRKEGEEIRLCQRREMGRREGMNWWGILAMMIEEMSSGRLGIKD